MKKKLKEIPAFSTEDEEREFWGKTDSSDYVDWENAEQAILPNLKRTTTTLSSLLSDSALDQELKIAGLSTPVES